MVSKGNVRMPTAQDVRMETEEEEEDDVWDEDDDIGEGNENLLLGPVRCLFCDRILTSAKDVFSHCSSDHSFSVQTFCGHWSLDCIGYIKMVNFIRKQHPSPDLLKELQPKNGSAPWEVDKYMIPVDPDDLLLQYDIESDDCSLGEISQTVPAAAVPDRNQASEEVVMKTSELQTLIQRMNIAESKVAALEDDLQRAVGELNCIRKTAQGLLTADGLNEDNDKFCGSSVGVIQRLTLLEDEAYFSSYADFSIHAEMLQDKVRSKSYLEFIFGNPEVFQDKIVLDVGCGTGILSLFAAKAGAKHVIGVDQSEIIYKAMDIATENQLQDKITFLKGRMEDVKLPYDTVDVIISEWMGYFLLFESMLDTVIVARNQYLSLGGHVYPDKCSLWLAGFSDAKLREQVVEFWDNVYGFKMNCMKRAVISQTAVDVVSTDRIITLPYLLKELDVNTCSLADVDFVSPFTLTCCKDGLLHGFVGYFDIGFEAGCSKTVRFSTGPASTSTHWKQTQFLLETPVHLTKGATMNGTVQVKKNKKDPRSLDIRITVDGKSQDYFMD